MKRYIEVTGEGVLVEPVVEYRAELVVAVRAAKTETAIAEAAQLRDETIQYLRRAGLGDNELKEGGAEVWRPWFWKKKPGEEASHTILVSSADVQRMYRALGSLEPLFANQRFSIAVSMRRPRFEANAAAHEAARTAAVSDARAKAQQLAQEAGVVLSSVVQIEERDDLVGRSGARGDEDWRGMYIAAGAAAAPDTPAEELSPAERRITLRYRVRFEVGGEQPGT